MKESRLWPKQPREISFVQLANTVLLFDVQYLGAAAHQAYFDLAFVCTCMGCGGCDYYIPYRLYFLCMIHHV